MTPNVQVQRRAACGASAATPGWAYSPKGRNEVLRRYVRLAQDAGKGADLQLTMHGNYAASFTSAHDEMTPALTDLGKPESLKRPHSFCTGYPGQLRHVQGW
jgi:hypothetical protein